MSGVGVSALAAHLFGRVGVKRCRVLIGYLARVVGHRGHRLGPYRYLRFRANLTFYFRYARDTSGSICLVRFVICKAFLSQGQVTRKGRLEDPFRSRGPHCAYCSGRVSLFREALFRDLRSYFSCVGLAYNGYYSMDSVFPKGICRGYISILVGVVGAL